MPSTMASLLPSKKQLRSRRTWRDSISIDALRAQILRHRSHHLLDGTLRHCVERIRRRHHRRARDARADEDDASARSHVWDYFLQPVSVKKSIASFARLAKRTHLSQEERTIHI